MKLDGSFSSTISDSHTLAHVFDFDYSENQVKPLIKTNKGLHFGLVTEAGGGGIMTMSSIHLLLWTSLEVLLLLQIYFADKQEYMISKMDFNGSNVNKLYTDWYGGTEGVAVDWVAK